MYLSENNNLVLLFLEQNVKNIDKDDTTTLHSLGELMSQEMIFLFEILVSLILGPECWTVLQSAAVAASWTKASYRHGKPQNLFKTRIETGAPLRHTLRKPDFQLRRSDDTRGKENTSRVERRNTPPRGEKSNRCCRCFLRTNKSSSAFFSALLIQRYTEKEKTKQTARKSHFSFRSFS